MLLSQKIRVEKKQKKDMLIIYETDDGKIIFNANGEKFKISCEKYTKLHDKEQFFFLHYLSKSPIWIPQSAFSSRGNMESFRQMAKEPQTDTQNKMPST